MTTTDIASPEPISSSVFSEGLDSIDWTFQNAETKYDTHGLHTYPARMIPQIPNALLTYFLDSGTISKRDTVYDPFVGSGTTLVEAQRNGLYGIGNDINPFACMLSRAKTTPIRKSVLTRAFATVTCDIQAEFDRVESAYRNNEDTVELPDVRDGWFPEPQLHQLAILRNRIEQLPETHELYTPAVVRFFQIVLSDITRDVSYQRNGEFKRYRMPEPDRKTHDPDVYSLFESKAQENIARVTAYRNSLQTQIETDVYYADSRIANDVQTNSVDITLTSPPYGDHPTTVAYGQFSQDPAIVSARREYDEMRTVDKIGLGGTERTQSLVSDITTKSETLAKTVRSLEDTNGRSDDAVHFFTDYYAVMNQVARVTKPTQPVIWIVANRTMSRINIPTHIITRELCETLGYTHEQTIPRTIPTKTLPWKNAPENITGKTDTLMADENIVITTAPN